MRALPALFLALSGLACATAGHSAFDLVVKQPEGEPEVPMRVLQEDVRARDCHIAWDSMMGPTVGQVVAMAIEQAPGANALRRVQVVHQIRNFRPWFFDRFCVEVIGDAVYVGEEVVTDGGEPMPGTEP